MQKYNDAVYIYSTSDLIENNYKASRIEISRENMKNYHDSKFCILTIDKMFQTRIGDTRKGIRNLFHKDHRNSSILQFN